MTFRVFNLETDELHGEFDSLDEALKCTVEDKLSMYEISGGGSIAALNRGQQRRNPYEGQE